MSNQTANDLLFGSGAPAAKFETIGTIVRGTVTETSVGQQRDFKTKEPLYWNNGRPGTIVNDQPVMQAIITIQTDERDGSDDDGRRRIYCGSRNMRDAVRDAVHNAGVKIIEPDGKFAVKYTAGSGETGDPKQYAAEYKPPAPAASAGLLEEPAAAQAVTAADMGDPGQEPF